MRYATNNVVTLPEFLHVFIATRFIPSNVPLLG